MATLEEARAANREVGKMLTHCFAGLVGSVSLGLPDTETGSDYHVTVGLRRVPTDEENSRLIHDFRSIPVVYRVAAPQ